MMKTRNQHKKSRYEAWSKILSTDWFVQILPVISYLMAGDLTNLDSAICNHTDRKCWLHNLSNVGWIIIIVTVIALV